MTWLIYCILDGVVDIIMFFAVLVPVIAGAALAAVYWLLSYCSLWAILAKFASNSFV